MHAHSWPSVFQHFSTLPKESAIPVILSWIQRQNIQEEIFPVQSMYDLLLTPSESWSWGNNIIHISEDNGKTRIRFFKHEGEKPEEDRRFDIRDGPEALRLMLAYKFGIHRNQEWKSPNRPVQLIPMPSALLAFRLRSRLGCQKQVGIPDRGRSPEKWRCASDGMEREARF